MATIVAAASLLITPGVGYAAPEPVSTAMTPLQPPPEPAQVDACNPADRSRFGDCKSRVYSFNLRRGDPVTGPIIGTAMASVTISEKTSGDSRDWTAHYTARIFGLTGEAATGTTAAVVAECRGDCTIAGGASQPNVPVVENSVITGDVRISGGVQAVSTSSQSITLHLFHPAAVNSGTTAGSPFSVLGPVRCDDGKQRFGIEGRPGCVLEDFDPTFVINSPEFPQPPAPLHAAFVARAQQNPKTQNLGRPGFGNPLIREFLPTSAQNKKRRMVCPANFPRIESPAGTPAELLDSCDEYPFSSSLQGTPQFAVTEHVPNGDNTTGGRRLLTFFARYHVMSGDAYYVQP
ncbi:NucA/NucB deoxyribonuclease domain-containing protein [Pseudonocardia humida]|uniref:Deoxyribonuclease NucA/NucB domain-containing protein n=1 Tax=Pseudonocardia humida TaxID=2800819 RepID=A0ABT1A9R4_9PSEU|nr:NucA/NucB deoxyribonuclease domain-containing protein [Pseudonocardia humida]MCO1659691.1 hypothetical protein [Pseudonocardia humida]